MSGIPLQLLLIILFFVGLLAYLITLIWERGQRKNLLKKYSPLNKNKGLERPIPWFGQLLEYPEHIFKDKGDEIKNKFIAAGFFNFKYSYLYIPVKFLLMIIGVSIVFFYGEALGFLTLNDKLIPIAIIVMFFIFAPDFYLDYRAKKLTQHVSEQLPYVLDLMGVCVQTGMTIEAAFFYLSKEMTAFDKITAHFLRQVDNRSRIIGMPDALQEFYEQVPSQEVHSFVLTLIQSLHYGTSIYTVLTTLSKDIREVQLLTIEEKIGKMSAKISIPLILFIMIPIVIIIVAPGLMRLQL